jgi:elongation factor Ts
VEIKATDVKKLRDKTGAGMMDCKKALVEANGDFARAEKILKELGLAAASKRAGRVTNEGRIFTKLTEKNAACLELSCETDFVAKNKDFQTLGETLVDLVVKAKPKESTKEMEDAVAQTIGKIKENITIRRFKILDATEAEFFTDYIHGEGKIGVIIKLKVENKELMKNEAIRELAFNLALHTAAFAPLYLSEEKIAPAYIKEQEEIFWKQAQTLGKPENVLQGIVKGKLKKHYAEICLLNQGYVKDEKLPVSKVLEEVGKQTETKITVSDFLYFRMGEEI